MKPKKNGRESMGGDVTRALGMFMQIGATMTASIVGGLLAGRWLDEKLGSSPWFSLGLLLLGVGGAVYFLFKITINSMK